MYFDYNGDWTGGHDVMGATAPGTAFYFAEGYTGQDGFDEWLCLANPGSSRPRPPSPTCSRDGTLTAAAGRGGRHFPRVGAGQRGGGAGPGGLGGGGVRSAHRGRAPHVLRLPRRLDGRELRHRRARARHGVDVRRGLHRVAVRGVADPVQPRETALPASPSPTCRRAGPPSPANHVVPAHSRYTIDVNADAGTGLQLSCRIVVTSGPGVVAERPMYFNYDGEWNGGHDAVGYRP